MDAQHDQHISRAAARGITLNHSRTVARRALQLNHSRAVAVPGRG